MFKRVYIEITNQCNLKCAFCDAHHRAPSFMSADKFVSILTQVREYTEYIYLHVQGEPLLHPGFEEILTLCDDHHMQVQLVTNGTFIDRYPEIYKHPSLRRISFSLQSLPYQSHKDHDRYIHDIMDFVLKAKEHVYIDLRVWANAEENPEIAGYIQSLKDTYDPQPTKRKDSISLIPNVYLSSADTFLWPSLDKDYNSDTGRCLGGTRQIAILAEGTVVPCCLDADGIISFGNIFEQSLAEILAGKRYTSFVHAMQNHRLSEELCQHCTYRDRFQ